MAPIGGKRVQEITSPHALRVTILFPESRKSERTAVACSTGAMNIMQLLEAGPETY